MGVNGNTTSQTILIFSMEEVQLVLKLLFLSDFYISSSLILIYQMWMIQLQMNLLLMTVTIGFSNEGSLFQTRIKTNVPNFDWERSTTQGYQEWSNLVVTKITGQL